MITVACWRLLSGCVLSPLAHKTQHCLGECVVSTYDSAGYIMWKHKTTSHCKYALSAHRASQNRARTNTTTAKFHKCREQSIDKGLWICRCRFLEIRKSVCVKTYKTHDDYDKLVRWCSCLLVLILMHSPCVLCLFSYALLHTCLKWCRDGGESTHKQDSARLASGCTEQDRSHKKYQYQNACIIEFSKCGWGVKRGGGIK